MNSPTSWNRATNNVPSQNYTNTMLTLRLSCKTLYLLRYFDSYNVALYSSYLVLFTLFYKYIVSNRYAMLGFSIHFDVMHFAKSDCT